MKEKLRREKAVKIAIPKGELLPDFLRLCSALGFDPKPIGKSDLVYTLTNFATPILMVAIRPRDIGPILKQPDSDVAYGFSGTDIAAEQALPSFDRFPRLTSDKPARLVVGSTPNWREKQPKQSIGSLAELPNARIVTPYPRLTQQWVDEQNLPTQVTEVGGATEGFWWLDSQCMAVLDVVASGKTFAENSIKEVTTVMEPIEITPVCAPIKDMMAFSDYKSYLAWDNGTIFDQLVDVMKGRLRGKREK